METEIIDDLKKMIKETQKDNQPMNHYSRVVIETKNSEPIAVITNDDCEVAEGFRVRLKPVYTN